MRAKLQVLLFALLTACSTLAAALPPSHYRVVEVGVVDGRRHYVSATAVSASGDITGWFGNEPSRGSPRHLLRPFLYHNGMLTVIDTPPTQNCQGLSVDSDATVLVACDRLVGSGTDSYLYRQGKLSPVSSIGQISQVSLKQYARGHAIGSGVSGSKGYFQDFITHGSNAFVRPYHEDISGIIAINEAGVALFSGHVMSEAGLVYDTVYHAVSPPPGIPAWVHVAAINSHGQVAGWISSKTFAEDTRVQHSFIWTKGVMTDLEPQSAANMSQPSGINDAGDVVGKKKFPGEGGPRPFIYTGGKFYDLRTLVDTSAILPFYVDVVGISASGAITLAGTHAEGGGAVVQLVPDYAPAAPVAAQAAAQPRCNPVTYMVFFDAGMDRVSPQAAAVLDNIAIGYRQCGRAVMVLAGHTDRDGSTEANLARSRRMAEHVRDYLGTRGVDYELMRIKAFGESHSLVPTPDGAREPQNRRVEISFGSAGGS